MSQDPPNDPFTSPQAEPEREPPVPPTEASNSVDELDKKVVNATTWSLGGQIVIQGLRLVQTVILTRLLFPAAFGAAELVMTIIIGLEMLSDLGIEPSIVHHKRGEERRFLDTAFTIQAIRGVVLFGAACACTPLVVWLANDPEVDVAWLVPLAAASAIILGFMPTKVMLLHRHLDLKRISILEVASFLGSMLITIAIASFVSAAWVLILAGVLVSLFTVLFGTIWLEGHINRPAWDPEAARDIAHFGKWIMLSTVITFLAERMTILVLPKLTDLNVLGVFAQANKFAILASVVTGPVVGQVMLPALAEAARMSHETLAAYFHRARATILRFLSFCTLGLAFFTPVFIQVALDDRYVDAGWMTQLALIGSWFNFLHFSWSKGVLATGHSRPLAVSNAIKFVATIVMTVGGFHLGGIPGLLIGSGVGSFIGHIVILIALQMNKLPAWGLDIRFTLLTLVLGLIGGTLPYAIGPAFGPYGFVVSQTIIGVVICTPMGIWSLRDVLRQVQKRRATGG